MFKIIPEKRMISSLINLNLGKRMVPLVSYGEWVAANPGMKRQERITGMQQSMPWRDPSPLKDKKNKKNEVIYGRSEILETNDKFKTIPREEQYENTDF
jgi:hypothetical protein